MAFVKIRSPEANIKLCSKMMGTLNEWMAEQRCVCYSSASMNFQNWAIKSLGILCELCWTKLLQKNKHLKANFPALYFVISHKKWKCEKKKATMVSHQKTMHILQINDIRNNKSRLIASTITNWMVPFLTDTLIMPVLQLSHFWMNKTLHSDDERDPVPFKKKQKKKQQK